MLNYPVNEDYFDEVMESPNDELYPLDAGDLFDEESERRFA